jgi:Putative prokaryotic signal transducing protein
VLEAEGIKCEIDGENQGSFTGVLEVRLLVRSWDEERARKVLAEHTHHHGGHGKKHWED